MTTTETCARCAGHRRVMVPNLAATEWATIPCPDCAPTPSPLAPDREASALLAESLAAHFKRFGLPEEGRTRIGLPREHWLLILHALTTLTARTAALAEAEARAERAAAERDRKWMEGVRHACAPDEITFDGLAWDALRVPLPTLHQFIRSLRKRAALASASPEPTTEPT